MCFSHVFEDALSCTLQKSWSLLFEVGAKLVTERGVTAFVYINLKVRTPYSTIKVSGVGREKQTSKNTKENQTFKKTILVEALQA